MSAIDVLRDEYPGDLAWERFVGVFRPAWRNWQEKDQYTDLLGGEEFAVVLTADFGARSVEWFGSPLPALGGRTPSDVLRNERLGELVIRSLLMRLPR